MPNTLRFDVSGEKQRFFWIYFPFLQIRKGRLGIVQVTTKPSDDQGGFLEMINKPLKGHLCCSVNFYFLTFAQIVRR